jgi:hypothetical protein
MSSIPKSLKHNNITDDEIDAYYALRPAKGFDYDFDKQFNKVLTEYIDTMSFKTPNAKRCYKKQLKKMALVDKPDNSPKYRQFILWRLKQISHHKNKQKEWLMTIDYNNSSKAKDMDDKLKEKDKIIKQLMQENQELKLKLEKYERMSANQPLVDNTDDEVETSDDEIETSDEEEEEPKQPEISNEQAEILDFIIADSKEEEVKPPAKQSNEQSSKKSPKKKREELELEIETEHYDEEDYKSMSCDEEKVEKFYLQMDRAIDECEQFFIERCNRNADVITDISNIFYDWHAEELENVMESMTDDNYDCNYEKLENRPFDILRDNLNQEAK